MEIKHYDSPVATIDELTAKDLKYCFVYHINNTIHRGLIDGLDAYLGRVIKAGAEYEVNVLTGPLTGKNIFIQEVNSKWEGPLPKTGDSIWFIDGPSATCGCSMACSIVPEWLVQMPEEIPANWDETGNPKTEAVLIE